MTNGLKEKFLTILLNFDSLLGDFSLEQNTIQKIGLLFIGCDKNIFIFNP